MRMCRPMAACVILTALWTPESAWSWGRIGHRVAAEMAEERLTPAALAAVRDLLGTRVRLADISTWADEQSEISRTTSWHSVNVPITESRYSPRFCRAEGCIVSKIVDFEHVLRDRKSGKGQKQVALKFLVHLIADLHQPLHVGDSGSKGGNLLQVRFFGVGTNLHRLWDAQIMERHTSNERVWLWDFDFLANPKMAAEWSKGNPETWATETLQIAKLAYCVPGTRTVMRSGTKLGNEYYGFALPIIQKQLAKAGIRTAWTLNEIFR